MVLQPLDMRYLAYRSPRERARSAARITPVRPAHEIKTLRPRAFQKARMRLVQELLASLASLRGSGRDLAFLIMDGLA
jgi:hypothetical protein